MVIEKTDMNYHLKWVDNNAIFTFFNKVDVDVVMAAFDEMLVDSKFENMKFLVADYSNVKSVGIPNNGVDIIQMLAKSSLRWNRKIKNANIATNEALKAHILHFKKEMEGTEWDCKLFEDFDSAIKWCIE